MRNASNPDHRVINETDAFPGWAAYDVPERKGPDGQSLACKIVLGQLGDEGAKTPLQLGAFPEDFDFATRFPKLTHLYLWNCAGFTTLPALPSGMKCLDVRGCGELEALPDLPLTLESLDLGDCNELMKLASTTLPKLERLFFNGCAKLKSHHVAAFLEANQDSPLVEIDGSGVSAVTSLAEFPRKVLRKLVLKGCTALTDASGIGGFVALDHLNFGGCTALRTLPDLPPKIRYLELFGAINLKDFMGQSLSPAELGTERGFRQNVAKPFKTLKKFGGQLAVMPHAKVLLLGDGRVGKTTLAKRLIWSDLSAAQRQLPENLMRKPKSGQLYTNSVEFLRWPTKLALPAGPEAPAETALTEGDVRIWDFGGQEIYHRTHRIFAGEGSVFLLVWCGQPLTSMERPAGVRLHEDVWKEVNATKSLDYWFDYVSAMEMPGRPKPEVALVCTIPHDALKSDVSPDWRTRAPFLAKSGTKAPEVFYIDTLDDRCNESGEYKRLVTWIRAACGRQAVTIGLRKPTFYQAVAGLIDGWLAENSKARASGKQPGILLRDAAQWKEDIQSMHDHDFPGSDLVPNADDINAITDYLHDTGHLFRLKSAVGDLVLVDQQWAAGVIYSLLDIQQPLWETVWRQGGYFTRRQLENQPAWEALKDDAQRERLLAYMIECGIVVQLADAERSSLNEELFLATDKWLLPPHADVRDRIQALVNEIEKHSRTMPLEKFEFEKVELTEFGFRAIQAILAQEFRGNAIYFREGVFAHKAPDWCFSVTWSSSANDSTPAHCDTHRGHLDARLIAGVDQAQVLAEKLTELLYARGSPLGERRTAPKKTSASEFDLRKIRFSLSPDTFQVGFSSGGKDMAEAREIYTALSTSFTVDFYAAKRPDQVKLGVFDYMKQMVNQPCIVVLLSEDYLRFDPASWHCAWELADAVRRLADGRRTVERTIVTYKNGADFNSRTADTVVHSLFERLRDHFAMRFRDKPPEQWDTFNDDREFAQHFAKAAMACGTFFSTRTTKGGYLRAELPGQGAVYADVVLALKIALGEASES